MKKLKKEKIMKKIIIVNLLLNSYLLQADTFTNTIFINKASSTPDISFDGHAVISAKDTIFMNINTNGGSKKSFQIGTNADNNQADSLFKVDSDAVVKIGNDDIILNKGKGDITKGADIYFKGAGSISSVDSLYLNIDSDNSKSGQFLVGRGSEKNEKQIKLFQIKEKNVAGSENGNGGYDEGTKTELKLYGNNENMVSSANIFYYTGKDETDNLYNYSNHREELSIMAGTDIVGDNNNASGIHYYGNNDSQHSGSIGMFTNGKVRLSINHQGRVGVGSKYLLTDFKNHYKGRFNIMNPINEPALYIQGASATEGDITWKDNESLQLGTWTPSTQSTSHKETINGTFNEFMSINKNGVVKIGKSDDKNNGYLQLDIIDTTPPSSDCDSDKYGRMIINPISKLLYICVKGGWITK